MYTVHAKVPRKFLTLETAKAFAHDYFERTGNAVAITAAKTGPTKAFQITVRRISNGCDYSMRLFAHDAEQAGQRAIDRARFWDMLPRAKLAELNAKGLTVYRVVSCEVSPDQSRPSGD